MTQQARVVNVEIRILVCESMRVRPPTVRIIRDFGPTEIKPHTGASTGRIVGTDLLISGPQEDIAEWLSDQPAVWLKMGGAAHNLWTKCIRRKRS